MSQLARIESAQKSLEECFRKKMVELEVQLQGGGQAKETVAKVAEEFRTFRELMYQMLGLLRKQIDECVQAVESIETRHRRKSLLLLGVAECDGENCTKSVLEIIEKKMGLKYSTSTIASCYRLGTPSKDHPRPILVKFIDLQNRSAVWRAKTSLKGSSISIREFLTKQRQNTFAKAKQHFGLRACWTQDGIIIVKAPDGSRHKVISYEELDTLLTKFPTVDGSSRTAQRK